jgi:pimeloyl-ACP methyl ester carboxylesterase
MRPPPGTLIDVEGHRVHLNCSGAGSPAVILEAALGGSSLSFTLVQPAIAQLTRTCSYDRAGFGWSDAGPCPRTAGRIVHELRTLLRAANVPPPYVLVGHSFGGLTSRLFAARYPDDVCGLVLLDPAYPEDWQHPTDVHRTLIERGSRLCRYGATAARLGIASMVARLTRSGAIGPARAIVRIVSRGGLRRMDEDHLAPLSKLPPDLRETASTFWTEPRFFEMLGSQIASMGESAAEVAAAPPIGDVPLVVVSGETNSDAGQLGRQERLALTSARGRHIVAERSGHWIPLDRPDVVIEAVRDVLATVRREDEGDPVFVQSPPDLERRPR